MKHPTVSLLSALILATLLVTGCGGGGAKVEAQTTTMGQELIDLDTAREKGLITDEEYEKSKKAIMKRYK